jgi:TonB-dependent Receptor Plug Domain
MNKYRCYLPIILLLVLCFLGVQNLDAQMSASQHANSQMSSAQNSNAQKLDSMLNIYANSFPQEKIHMHLDKKIYRAGETIWFKAYIFTGADPSLLSRNFYAELSDPSGAILQRKVYPITESSSAGSFDVPVALKDRHLHLRAYTTWMTNFDTAFYYEKDIRIYDSKLDSAAAVTVVHHDARIQFFPEGGDLVGGVETMLAFKANDQFGLPVAVKGVVQDHTGKELLMFESAHDGMGKFPLTPDAGDSLVAIWKDEQGIEHRTGLPAAKPSGAVIRAITGNQKVLFSVARSAQGGPELRHLTIIAHMHQHLVYKARINLEDNFMSGGTIPTGQLPSGVLQLTVFNADMMPVAERVVFVNNHEYLFSPELSIQMKGVARRGKNSLTIEVPDTLRSNLSLAVTDVTADGEFPDDDNIISRLLLTGEIRGEVHNPYFYFESTADSLVSMLDLVMMTHGWRRIKWEALTRGQLPVIKNPEQNYLSMKVDVLGVDAYKIARDETLNVILSKKDSSTQMLQLPHLSGSKFGVSGLIFFDTARAFYQFNVNHALADQAAVTFNTGLVRGNRSAIPLSSSFEGWTAEDSAYLRRNRYIAQEAIRAKPVEDQKVKTLAAVTVRGHIKTDAERMDERYASGMFSGGDAYTYDLVDDPLASAMTDIFMYLQGKVPGLQITPGNGPGGAPSLSWRGGKPTLYLNEMQVDASQLQNTPVPDIAMVKVFRPGSGVGFGGGAGGTIAIYTKKGGDNKGNDANFKGLPRALLVGYSMPREFYSPNYLENSPLNEAEDLRTTLYWKPYVLTDKDSRRMSVDFFNNDITKKLRVVLEGFNEEGKLTHIEQIIQ